MTQLDLDPLRRIAAAVSALAWVLLAWVLVLALGVPADAWARQAEPPPAATAARAAPDESLTVLGRRHHFEAAPVPGAPLGPPPDKPGPHLGRYKISGDQSAKDGFDAQTGAFIAPFGSAYTGASPTAGGLASHFGH